MEQFRDRLTQVADRAVQILRRLDEEVLTPTNTQKLSAFVNDLSKAASDVSATLERFRATDAAERAGQLVKQLSDVAGRLDTLLADFSGRGASLSARLDETLLHVDEVAVAVRDLARGMGEQVAGERAPLGGLLAELTATATRLQETLDVIRSDPSLLMWGRPVPEREFAR
jgi:hypothetical protein